MKDVQVAGKTGTAQAMLNGKKDTVAWFCCFAPYRSPAIRLPLWCRAGAWRLSRAPIATRILERTLAMDQGKFEPQLAWLAPAHKANPFDMIQAVNYKDAVPAASDDEKPGAMPASGRDRRYGKQPAMHPMSSPTPTREGKQCKCPSPRGTRRVPVATPAPQRPRRLFRADVWRSSQSARPLPPRFQRARAGRAYDYAVLSGPNPATTSPN